MTTTTPPPASQVSRHRVPFGTVRAAGIPDPSQLPLLSDQLPRVDVSAVPETLARRLRDPRWVLVLADGSGADVVVAVMTSVDDLADARRRRPGAALLAVLATPESSALAVPLLNAGATGCVRGCDADEIAAHLAALTRRMPVAAA